MPQRTVRLNGKRVTAEYGHVPAQGTTAAASEQLLRATAEASEAGASRGMSA